MKLFKLTLVALLVSFFFGTTVNASEDVFYDLEVDTNYQIQDDFSVAVDHKFILTNKDLLSDSTEISIPLTGYNVRNVNATYQDGIGLVPSVNGNKLSFIVGPSFSTLNQQWNFSVSYTSDLKPEGALPIEVYYLTPATIQNSNLNRHTILLSSDVDLGEYTILGPELDSVRGALGSRFYNFEVTSSQENRAIIIADKERFDFQFTANAGVILPSDNSTSEIYLENSGSDTDRPVSLGEDFNLVSTENSTGFIANKIIYPDSGQSSGVVSAEVRSQLGGYLGISGDWSNFDVLDIDSGLTSDLDAVNSLLLTKPDGDFQDNYYKVGSFIATLRKNNIPARMVYGHSYLSESGVLSEPVEYYWAEVFLGGIGWIQIDYSRSADINPLSHSNPFLVSLATWGISDTAVDFSQTLAVNDYSATNFSNFDGVDSLSVFTAKLERKAIIPGLIFFDKYIIESPAGYIADDNALRHNEDILSFGSMAPLSTVSKSKLGIANSGQDFSYGILLNGEFSQLHPGGVEVSYLYSLILLVLILVLAGSGWLAVRQLGSSRKEIVPKTSNFKHPLKR